MAVWLFQRPIIVIQEFVFHALNINIFHKDLCMYT